MFFRNLGLPELLLLVAIALLIFGPGRVSELGRELGRGIRNFREGLEGDNESPSSAQETRDAS